MKRRELIIIASMMLSGAVLYIGLCKLMGYSVLNGSESFQVGNRVETRHEGERLPSIDMLLPDSVTHINISSVKTDRPIVLFLFGPDCPYCHQQVLDIIHNIKDLRGVEFYLITSYPFKDMRRFYEQFHLDRYPNVIVGVDFTYSFMKYFNTVSIPYLAIYNRRQTLQAAYIGVVGSEYFRKLGG